MKDYLNQKWIDKAEQKARDVLAGVPRIKVYQWFGLSLSGGSTPTMVTVEVETKSYVLNRPKRTTFAQIPEWQEATRRFKTEQQAEAAKVIESVKPILTAAGIKFRTRNEYGWAKLDLEVGK